MEKIEPEKTLIIFDEIQECSNALNSLKYFCEEASEYHIVCAGSLFGIRLSKTSFPIGKIEFLNLYPMSFSVFLIDNTPNNYVFDRNKIYFVIQSKNKIIPIEVKSSRNTKHISLTKFSEKNNNEISIVFSLNNSRKYDKIINIPLYFIEYISNLSI